MGKYQRVIQNQKYLLLLIIILAFSGFVHLYNAVEFPSFFYDEGVYMRRAMHILTGLGLQERYWYDHPYFGPLFLAGIFSAIGYPSSLHPLLNVDSIASLWLIPRLLMGLLGIADTFLIFKISEKYYNTKTGIAASFLFAVMPLTWLTRRILLDSILLPFLLLAILFALYSKDSKHKSEFVLLSGICMGITIFTKEYLVVMLPLLVFILYKNVNLKKIGLWLIPVVLIPSIWIIESMARGEFNLLMADIMSQTERANGGLLRLLGGYFLFDPVLFILGLGGLSYAAIKKQVFPILWSVPFLILFSIINYVQYFYLIPIIPVFCIAGGYWIMDIKKNIKSVSLSYPILLIIVVFGLVSTTMIITTNVSDQLEATAFVASYLDKNKDATVISSPVYSWIFHYVFHDKSVFSDYRDLLYCPLPNENIILVASPEFHAHLDDGRELPIVYGNTTTIENFSSNVFSYDNKWYPYTNLWENFDGSIIDIRTADKQINTGVPLGNSTRNICLNYFS
jgi:4-amino-4-deoxy-L-arabinose transferase-like glycosyltransferase